MEELHAFLQYLLPGIEFASALVAAFYFFRLKESYWRWFCIYLIFIFIQEVLWIQRESLYGIAKTNYYAFLGIPIQYLFLFWLYALKSLKNAKLFVVCSFVFLISLSIEASLEELNRLYPISLGVGIALLTILLVLELNRQIKNDDILKLRENKMFYISMAIIVFWIATYPFWIFRSELYTDHRELYFYYYTYVLIANCSMYLLFIASFIWGKEKS